MANRQQVLGPATSNTRSLSRVCLPVAFSLLIFTLSQISAFGQTVTSTGSRCPRFAVGSTVSEPPALSIARVVCFCHPIAVIISSRVVPPSRLSIAITWLVLLPSRGALAFVAATGAFFARVAFFFEGACSGATSGICGATGVAGAGSGLSGTTAVGWTGSLAS